MGCSPETGYSEPGSVTFPGKRQVFRRLSGTSRRAIFCRNSSPCRTQRSKSHRRPHWTPNKDTGNRRGRGPHHHRRRAGEVAPGRVPVFHAAMGRPGPAGVLRRARRATCTGTGPMISRWTTRTRLHRWSVPTAGVRHARRRSCRRRAPAASLVAGASCPGCRFSRGCNGQVLPCRQRQFHGRPCRCIWR